MSARMLRVKQAPDPQKEALRTICDDLYDLRAMAMSAQALVEEFSDCDEHNAVSRMLRQIADKAANLACLADKAVVEGA